MNPYLKSSKRALIKVCLLPQHHKTRMVRTFLQIIFQSTKINFSLGFDSNDLVIGTVPRGRILYPCPPRRTAELIPGLIFPGLIGGLAGANPNPVFHP